MSIIRSLQPVFPQLAAATEEGATVATVAVDLKLWLVSMLVGDDYLVELDTQLKPDGSRETLYQIIGTDPEHPASLRVGIYPGKARTNISMKYMYWMCSTSGDGVEVWTQETDTFATSVASPTGFSNGTDWEAHTIVHASVPLAYFILNVAKLANGLTRVK